jgi:flagellar basal body-associated protein FliL
MTKKLMLLLVLTLAALSGLAVWLGKKKSRATDPIAASEGLHVSAGAEKEEYDGLSL